MANPEKKKSSLLFRIFKWTGISLLIIVLLLIAAPFIFKDKIVALVKEQANANLNAKVDFGEFDLSLISSFPDFRFEINKVSVIGVGAFDKDTLLYLEQLRTDINLKSVLSGSQYQINSILINKARIFAKILPNGKANYDIAKSDSSAAPQAENADTSKFAMKLKAFNITESLIEYDDKQGNMYARIENMNYSMNGDFTQDVFIMNNLLDIAKLTFKMDGIAYLSNVHTTAKADMEMDMPKFKFTFKDNEFALNDLALGMDGWLAMPDTNMDMALTFKAKQTEFKSILSLIPSVYSKDFAGIKTSGKLSLDGHVKGRYNAAQMPAFGLNLSIEKAMFKYPSLPKAVNNINVDVKVQNPDGNLDHTLVDINTFHVEMAGNPVDLRAHIQTPISDPGIEASLKGLINLSSVKEFVPLDKGDNLSGTIKSDISLAGHMSSIDKKEYDKFKASGSLEIDKMDYKSSSLTYPVLLNTLKLNFTTQYVELAAFDAMLGKSDVQAQGKIENFMQYVFKDDLIKGSFSVNSKLLDLNELMGPEDTATAAADTAASASSGVIEVPANIDFNLNARFDKVLYSNMVLENMLGNLVIRNRKIDMSNLKMNTMGGSLVVNGYYETNNPKRPTTALNLKVENFDIQQTFKTFNTVQKLAPAGEYAKGLFTATLEDFNVGLNDKMEPDMNTVAARGVFKTKKVNVSGFPPFMKLGDALKIEQLKSMDLTDLNLNYAIKNGRLYLEPFNTKVNQVSTNIEGSTGLDQSIDYKWKMEIPRAMFGSQANSALQGLMSQANSAAGTSVTLGEKINVNVLFAGTVTKPTVKTSLKEEGKSAVATVTTQALNAGIDKANEEAQKILADAQAQVDKIRAETAVIVEKTKTDGYAQADALVEQATNPLTKVAAKKAADVAKKEADKKAQKILDESEARCQKILADAKVKADAKAAEAKK
ncbi:MAG TPA: AsmA-like C-terminal region-containing protein [Bacteroidia bacterium]|nr:AsmA-like C-terminal region-containing protein [Bacteroidia bacterium]